MKARSFVLALVVLLAISSCYASVSQDALAKFSKWAQEKKIHSKFNLAYFENEGLGGVARTDILDGDTLVKIPRSVLVTLSEAKAKAPIQDWPGVIEYEPLIYWILSQAADPNSEYRPYIDVLPTDYSKFHPFYWADDVWSYCDGTGLKEFIQLHRAAAAKSYELFTDIINEKYPNLFPAGFLTQDKYAWAYLAVQSRTWQIDDGGVRDIAVVPVADLLNHSPTAGGGALIGDHFVINATQDYSADDQVYDSYGAKSNFELLSVYGFLLRDNPVKALNLHFSFKENNLVHSIVEPLLRAQDPKYSTITIRENYVPAELLRAFRLSVMEFSELDYVNRALAGKPVSLKNELRAFRAAIKALSGLLEAYPTTEEEDLALGESGNLTANQQTALYLRISERSVAKNVILVVAKMWENILLEGQLFGEVSIE